MKDRYYKQELIARLQYLAAKLEEEGKQAKIIHDTIAYIADDKV